MRTCEICCRKLRKFEEITCNPCEADRIRSLLASRAWMKIRGSTVDPVSGRTLADSLRTDLAALEVVR